MPVWPSGLVGGAYAGFALYPFGAQPVETRVTQIVLEVLSATTPSLAITGTGAVVVPPMVLQGAGALAINAAGDFVAPPMVLQGTGTVTPLYARATQVVLEVFGARPAALARATQVVLEVFGTTPEMTFPRDLSGDILVAWIEFTDAQGTTHVWSDVALPDPATYYFGNKDARVTRWGTIRRSLSDDLGEYVGSEFSFTVSDADHAIRTLLADAATRAFTNRAIVTRMITDAGRRALQRPRDVFVGALRDYQPGADLTFTMTARDSFDTLFSVTGGQLFPRRTISLADFPQCNDVLVVPNADPPRTIQIAAADLPVPIIYGTISDTQSVYEGGQWLDAGDGQCPVILVGVVQLAGASWYRWLVCGHACQGIDEVYIQDTPIGLQPPANTGVGGEWLIPGYPGWAAVFGNTRVEVINGHAYTTIYGRVGFFNPDWAAGVLSDVAPPFAITVRGITTNADGSGPLITDGPAQYLHCLQNWVVGDYQSGPWLATPKFNDKDALPLIDEGSFARASAVARARVTGGYRGDFVIGATAIVRGSKVGAARLTAREVVKQFNASFDVSAGFNRRSQFMITMIDDTADGKAAAAIAPLLTDVVDILQGTLTITDRVPALFNHLAFRHTQDYLSRMGVPQNIPSYADFPDPNWRSLLASPDYVEDAASIKRYSFDPARPVPIPGATWYLPMVRGKNRAEDWDGYRQGTLTANDVVARVLRRHANPPRQVELKVGTIGLNLDLGDVIRVTHFAGLGPSGWTARPLWIVAHDSDPGQKTVTITALDLQPIFDEAP
jgi:hypothetical protein